MVKPSVSNLSDCVGVVIHTLLLRTCSNLICVYVCTCNHAVTLGYLLQNANIIHDLGVVKCIARILEVIWYICLQ